MSGLPWLFQMKLHRIPGPPDLAWLDLPRQLGMMIVVGVVTHK